MSLKFVRLHPQHRGLAWTGGRLPWLWFISEHTTDFARFESALRMISS